MNITFVMFEKNFRIFCYEVIFAMLQNKKMRKSFFTDYCIAIKNECLLHYSKKKTGQQCTFATVKSQYIFFHAVKHKKYGTFVA